MTFAAPAALLVGLLLVVVVVFVAVWLSSEGFGFVSRATILTNVFLRLTTTSRMAKVDEKCMV